MVMRNAQMLLRDLVDFFKKCGRKLKDGFRAKIWFLRVPASIFGSF